MFYFDYLDRRFLNCTMETFDFLKELNEAKRRIMKIRYKLVQMLNNGC